MSNNIIEQIQKALNYPELQKVDPNVQEIKDRPQLSKEEKLAQAAIPAVLAALYRYTDTDQGSEAILSSRIDGNLINNIFQDKQKTAVEKVAQYAGVSPDLAGREMERVAQEAARSIREAVKDKPSVDKVKEYMSSQRHNILVHLPAAMQLGDLLNDNSMDDRTNKMEGPISNLMHKIENSMSKNDKE